MSNIKVESAIIDLIGETPRSPLEVVVLLGEKFPMVEVRDAIWNLIDGYQVEPNADLKLEVIA